MANNTSYLKAQFHTIYYNINMFQSKDQIKNDTLIWLAYKWSKYMK